MTLTINFEVPLKIEVREYSPESRGEWHYEKEEIDYTAYFRGIDVTSKLTMHEHQDIVNAYKERCEYEIFDDREAV